jgi:hypothetical protein
MKITGKEDTFIMAHFYLKKETNKIDSHPIIEYERRSAICRLIVLINRLVYESNHQVNFIPQIQ